MCVSADLWQMPHTTEIQQKHVFEIEAGDLGRIKKICDTPLTPHREIGLYPTVPSEWVSSALW